MHFKSKLIKDIALALEDLRIALFIPKHPDIHPLKTSEWLDILVDFRPSLTSLKLNRDHIRQALLHLAEEGKWKDVATPSIQGNRISHNWVPLPPPGKEVVAKPAEVQMAVLPHITKHNLPQTGKLAIDHDATIADIECLLKVCLEKITQLRSK